MTTIKKIKKNNLVGFEDEHRRKKYATGHDASDEEWMMINSADAKISCVK